MNIQFLLLVVSISLTHFISSSDMMKPDTSYELIRAIKRNHLTHSNEILRRSGDDVGTKSALDLHELKYNSCHQGHLRKTLQDEEIERYEATFLALIKQDKQDAERKRLLEEARLQEQTEKELAHFIDDLKKSSDLMTSIIHDNR